MPVGAVSQGHLPFVLVPTFLGGGFRIHKAVKGLGLSQWINL